MKGRESCKRQKGQLRRDQSLITATTTAAQNGGVFIRSGHKRNIEEVRADIENAENLLMLQNNVN